MAQLDSIGLVGPHLHDLRHAGNVLSAAAGANLRELTERMGHSSTKAALIYLHGGDARQRSYRGGSQRPRAPRSIGIGRTLNWHACGTGRLPSWLIMDDFTCFSSVTCGDAWSRRSESNR